MMKDEAPIAVQPDLVSDALRCAVCLNIVTKPTSTPCHHLFCFGCISQALRRNPSCPTCRAACPLNMAQRLTPGSLVYRIWSDLQVKCHNHGLGCTWTGSIEMESSHRTTCPYGTCYVQENETLRQKVDDQAAQLHSLKLERDGFKERLEATEFLLQASTHETTRLREKLKTAKMESLFSGTYHYNRSNVVELSQLISRHLENRPTQIDPNRIYNCVRSCHLDLKRGYSDNPAHYYIDMRMLLTTCAASTWFSDKQNKNIRQWLSEHGWD